MIERIPYPEALPVSTQDYVRQNNLIETGFLRVNDPWPVVGGNIVRGSVFQLGGTVYHATSDTVIGGVASDYVKLTPSGDGSTCAADYVASLAGVSWSQIYNGYYDVGGNLYLFDEVLAVINGELAAYNTRLAYATRYNYAIYRDILAAETAERIDTKIIEIGNWDMDATVQVNIAHGLTNWKNIRSLNAIIRKDIDNLYFSLKGDNHGSMSIDVTNVNLTRKAGGLFDNPAYNDPAFDRGWITVEYEI